MSPSYEKKSLEDFIRFRFNDKDDAKYIKDIKSGFWEKPNKYEVKFDHFFYNF